MNEIVSVETNGDDSHLVSDPSLMPTLPAFRPQQATYWCSLPQETREEREEVHALLASPGVKTEDMVGIEIGIVAVAVVQGERLDLEAGEIVPYIMYRALLEDGTIVHGGGKGWARSIASIVSIYGVGRYDPPVRGVILEVATKHPNPTYVFAPACRATAKPTKKKG